MRGGRCDNPTVNSFLYGTSSLRVQGSLAVKSVRGNCKRGCSKSNVIIDEKPLPKRPRRPLEEEVNIREYTIVK